MDKVTIEEDKKGTKNFLILIFGLIIAGAVIGGALTNYKEEVLTCSKSKNICTVQKTNLINQKFKKDIIKYSDISDVGYFKERVKGNRYAKGYSSYLLTFVDNNNNNVIIFSGAYYDKKELNKIIKTLSNQVKSGKDDIGLVKK